MTFCSVEFVRVICGFALGMWLFSLPAYAAHPGFPVTFFWCGEGCGNVPSEPSGNGNTADWQNYKRNFFDPDDQFYAPQAGDVIDIGHTLIPDIEPRRSIGIGDMSLDVGVLFAINGDMSGGTLNVDAIRIVNHPYDDAFYSMTFTGSTMNADDIIVESFVEPVTLSEVNLIADQLKLTGGDRFVTYSNLGVGVTNIVGGSTIDVSTFLVGEDDFGSGARSTVPYTVHVEASTITGLGMELVGGINSGTESRVELTTGSQTDFSQFVVIGTDARGEVILTGNSRMTVGQYLNVGDFASGFMRVAESSEVHTSDLDIGVYDDGIVSVDSNGKLFSTLATMGTASGHVSSMNVEGGGRWETDGLRLGMTATGYVYVRDEGMLKIKTEAILGVNSGSRGVLNLIGSDAKLELDPGATLTIGKEGTGELHLSEGARYKSEGSVSLGDIAGGTGIVTIDGEESVWEVTGELTIGERSNGEVEIKNGGKLSASGATMYLGKEANSDGKLTIEGHDSTLDFEGSLLAGYRGKGLIALKDDAAVTTDKLVLGYFANSEGKLETSDSFGNQGKFTANDDITIGKGGRGIVSLDGHNILQANGMVTIGEEGTSGTENEPNRVTFKDRSTWHSTDDVVVGKAAGAHSRVELNDFAVIRAEGAFFDLGLEQGSHGVLKLDTTSSDPDGSLSTINSDLRVGVRGNGELQLDGRTQVYVQAISVGIETYGSGKVHANGNDVMLTVGDLDVGGLGVGEVMIENGAEVKATSVLGVALDSAVSNGASLTLKHQGADGASRLLSNRIVIGDAGWGSLDLQDQAELKARNEGEAASLYVALKSSSHGGLHLNTGSKVTVQNFEVGRGTAEVSVSSDSTLRVDQSMSLGSQADGGSLQMTVDAATINAKNVTLYRNASVTISNGGHFQLKPSGAMVMGGAAMSPAQLAIHGGELIYDGNPTNTQLLVGQIGPASLMVDSGGHVELENIALGHGSGNVAVTATVSGANSFINSATLNVHRGATLTASGGGQVQAQAAAGINGTVNVMGGMMLVGPISAGDGLVGEVTVLPGGRLGGAGTIQGRLRVKGGVDGFTGRVTGGRVKPGNSPGTLNVEGDLIVEDNTVLELEIGGLATEDHDVIHATGAVEIAGNVLLQFVNGFAPSIGEQFALITGTTLDVAPNVFARNLAPGWQYDVEQAEGSWLVTSLSDAVYVLPGDYNQDGNVDAADYTVWRDAVGQVGLGLVADGDYSGVVDEGDYDVWKSNFGAGNNAGAAAGAADFAVPEPSAGVFILATMVATCGRRNLLRRKSRVCASIILSA